MLSKQSPIKNGVAKTLFLLSFFFFSADLYSQIYTPAFRTDSTFKNSISFGPSYGWIMERDADFWGLSLGYSRQISNKWVFSPSIAYDKETEYKNEANKVVNTLTSLVTLSYFLSPKWSLTAGFAKGFIDDDNPEKKIDFVDGDWATGISLGFSLPNFPFWKKESFSISAAYEYNFSQKEFSISLDLVMGLSW